MSSTRSRYRELGLKLFSLEEKYSCQPMRSPMVEQRRDKGVKDPIKLLLTKALAQQRKDMLGNFSQILQWLPTIIDTSSSSSLFGYATPFKVQVNFDIPIFEGKINAYALEKWLNLLEGYFSIHNFFDRENITFVLLKVLPHVKCWWETY